MPADGVVIEPPQKLKGNIFSSVFVTWMTPLLLLGSRRPLDILDLSSVPKSYEAGPLAETLSKAWREKVAKGSKRPLLKSLWTTFGLTFCLGGLFLIAEFTVLAPPLILRTVTAFCKSRENGNTQVPWPFNGLVSENYFVVLRSGRPCP